MDAVSQAFPELTARAQWTQMDWRRRGAWSGLRPTTPDSLPILSRHDGDHDNVYINAGHGTMGWTLSMGSADVIAALALGQPQVGDRYRPS